MHVKFMYVCVCVYVCMYVYVHTHTLYVRTYVCMYVHIQRAHVLYCAMCCSVSCQGTLICADGTAYAFIYVCMYACMYICMFACMHACMHACMYVCMYVCVYVHFSKAHVLYCAVMSRHADLRRWHCIFGCITERNEEWVWRV
jgi:hypothetical protein